MLIQSYVHGPNNKMAQVHKDQHGDFEVKHFIGGKHVDTKKFSDSGQAHSHAKMSIKEDAPVNSAGNGGVQGIGVGPKGEPGGKKALLVKKILRRRKLVEQKLLDVPTPNVKTLAKRNQMSVKSIQQQLSSGIKVEKEHTTKTKVAKEIALDHLGEKPNYYKLLKKVEK